MIGLGGAPGEDFSASKLGRLTNGGDVLFARNPAIRLPQVRVRAMRYNSDKAGEAYRDMKSFEGPLQEVFEDAYGFIIRNTPTMARFEPGQPRRQDEPLYPEQAVREALTRICRHTEAQDSWTREIDIYLPVRDLSLWEKSRGLLSDTLEFLTGDKWRFFFRERPKGFTKITKRPKDNEQEELELDDKPTVACLFSGGLDSFIGAIDLLEAGENPLLVSHSWVTSVSGHQNECTMALEKEYGEARIRRMESRAGLPKQIVKGVEGENTERSRSFLFFSLAAFAASGFGKEETPIFVPENGLISLNIPLDPLRLGSLSTRTTHPYYMRMYNKLLSKLGIPAKVTNPYGYETKGEMVAGCKNQKFLGK